MMVSTASETKWYSYTSSTQTMRTWSEIISSFQTLAEFQPAFPASETTFPYTVCARGSPLFVPETQRHAAMPVRRPSGGT